MGRAAGKGRCYAAGVTETPLTGPEHGGRLLARLRTDEQTPAMATYGLALATASATWEAPAAVHELDGRVELGAWTGVEPPPAWLVQAAHALLRGAWQRQRAGHPWPRRLSRWRPAPESGES
jgi:hypothetical protein